MAKGKDGLRQRKKGSESANGEGDAPKPANTKPNPQPPKKQPSTAPEPKTSSSGGMTCLNWFIVLFLILGVSGGVGFFIYNEMTMTNRALLKEIERLKSESSDVSGFSDQIKSISTKLGAIEELRGDLATVKETEKLRGSDFSSLASQIKRSQQKFDEVTKKFGESMTRVDNLQKDIDNMKSTQSQSKDLDETKVSIERLNELIEVSKTNDAYLSDELVKLDKRLTEYFAQTSSIQKEVIDLTADKVAMSSSIDSIKTTVVQVRDSVGKAQQASQGGTQEDAESVKKQVQELDTRMSGEVERLSRQLSETSENSAKWLQQATNDLGEQFRENVEKLNKQISELKVSTEEPAQATEDQSIINSVAALDKKLNGMAESLHTVETIVWNFDEKNKKNEASADKEMEEFKLSIAKLTERVMEVKSQDGQREDSLDELTKQVTTLSNQFNGLRTTARILESRVEEIRTGRVEEPPKPADPNQQAQQQTKI